MSEYQQLQWGGGGGIFLQDLVLTPPSRFKKVFLWIIVEKGLGFFLYFVQEIGKTANFPSLDYKEYSSHP